VFYAADDKVSITLSIGLTQFDSQRHSAVELIKEADMALYEAKNNGKNQVVMFGVHRPLTPAEAKQAAQSRMADTSPSQSEATPPLSPVVGD
jgi:predicted signal transduction protein with EAL and GGDEF domain